MAYKYEKGIGDPNKVNSMHDGNTIRYKSTIKTKDGRVFWIGKGLNNKEAPYMELVQSISGRWYNVNLNNGMAYDTQLKGK